jgi:hypothetical protein
LRGELSTVDPLLKGHPFYNEKGRIKIVIFYYLSAPEIWSDNSEDLWWNWLTVT